MLKEGRVFFGSASARLDDGTVLAICGLSDPFGAAIGFLEDKNIESGERIIVTGSMGMANGQVVFCMTDAVHAPLIAAASAKKAAAKKGKKAKKPSTKQPSAKKAPSKKSSAKKASKKPAKKSSAKKASKKPAKKSSSKKSSSKGK